VHVTVLAERYELGDVLGEGGMGRVVIAHDRVLRRDVAVKLLTGASDAASRARFLREARDSARLRHPNAVTVYDTGEHEGQPFIVMELVRGITLDELVAEDGPLAVEVAVAITVGVLEALDAAHAAGLVHRDVKPGNVILPDDGGVKLTDFGIAKAMDDATAALTAAGTVLGTPAYLAPELVDGGTASPASDLYAVGCMLYLQLTGEPPFSAETPLAIAYAHVNRAVPPVEEQRPDVPDDLGRVLDTALAKDPAQRYADAAAMRAALLGEDLPAAPRQATLPLTTAFTPAAATPAAASPAASPAAASPSANTDATGQGAQDATVALADGSSPASTSNRSAWRTFAIGAVLLLAFVALVVAWPFGGTDTDDEPGEQEEPEEPGESPDDPTSDDPAPGDPSPDDPAPDPAPDQPAPDGPTPDEPAPEQPAPEQPVPEGPDEADEPPPADTPDGDAPGDGQGPDGEGPPGQNGAPGQEG
jgi:eukaryotic-like serine/threonine-protein kinase